MIRKVQGIFINIPNHNKWSNTVSNVIASMVQGRKGRGHNLKGPKYFFDFIMFIKYRVTHFNFLILFIQIIFDAAISR